jgi:hypothetical protein
VNRSNGDPRPRSELKEPHYLGRLFQMLRVHFKIR